MPALLLPRCKFGTEKGTLTIFWQRDDELAEHFYYLVHNDFISTVQKYYETMTYKFSTKACSPDFKMMCLFFCACLSSDFRPAPIGSTSGKSDLAASDSVWCPYSVKWGRPKSLSAWCPPFIASVPLSSSRSSPVSRGFYRAGLAFSRASFGLDRKAPPQKRRKEDRRSAVECRQRLPAGGL
jgi:hypothetical protein